MKRSTIRSTSVILVIVLVCCTFLFFTEAVLAYGPLSSNKIRVAQIDLSNFYDYDQDGPCAGYGFEYLQEIANYTGWEYEFIPLTYEKSLQMLEEGSIDLVAPVSANSDLRKKYDFSAHEVGLSYSLLCVAVEDRESAVNDFKAFNKMKIGQLKNASVNASLNAFAESNHFQAHTVSFDNQASLLNALHDGEIDAILTTSLEKRPTERVVAKFTPSPYYFITAKGNDQILDPLNTALNDIKVNNPYFDYELQKKYFDIDKNTIPIFTEKEREYIQNSNVLKTVYSQFRAPFEYYDEKGGFQGIDADIFHLIGEKTGLHFSYIKAASYNDALQTVSDHNADIMTSVNQRTYWTGGNHLMTTDAYLTAPIVLVKNINKNNLSSVTAALTENNSNAAEYIKKINPDAKIIYFDTLHNCFEAVNSGKADITYTNSYEAEMFLRKPKLNKLEIIKTENLSDAFSIGISDSVDPILLSILNKALLSISDAQLNNIIFEHTTNENPEINFEYLFYKNPGYLLLSLLILLLTTTMTFVLVIKFKNTHTKEIKKVAYTDSVTGAWNYNRFKLEARSILENAKSKKYAIVYLDINKFSYINDTFGYGSGDLILSEVAKTLQLFLRDTECCARLSADNFVCLLEYLGDTEIMERGYDFQCLCDERLKKINNRYKVYFTSGIYIVSHGETDIPSLVGKAEIAYRTLGNVRKETVAIYNDKIQNEYIRKKELESSMVSALKNKEFLVYLQPKMNLDTNTIVGAEALVRWKHPVEGLILPQQFISLFESNGFILDLDFYVYENVCHLLRKWLNAGNRVIPVSVNVSKAHLSNQQFVSHLKALTDKYRIPPYLLELELTESIFLHDSQEAFTMIRELKNLGFSISIDDFGSGYSSLNLLKDLIVDVLKLDKEFFRKEGMTDKDKIIVDGIIKIANDLNLKIISEGVETREQVDFLINAGCHIAQGYFFSKPIQVQAFEDLAGFLR